MELTTTTFENIFEEKYSECDHLHQEWLEDETGQVESYTNDDVHDDSIEQTREFFMELGYTSVEIAKVEEELWG
jgi:hypothetical protein